MPNLGKDLAVHAAELQEDLQEAIQKCQSFLIGKELDHDEYWMAKQVALLLGGEYPHWSLTLKLTQEAYSDDLRDFAQSADFVGKTPPHIPLPENIEMRVLESVFQDYGVMKIMSLAFQCLDEYKPEAYKELLEHVSVPGFGYGVSHQLWALVSMYSRGYMDDETYLQLAYPLARILYEELLARFDYSDITMERMAFLCYANLGDWIPKKFLLLALASQNEDGSWPRVKNIALMPASHNEKNDLISAEHTTSLALYAFASIFKSIQSD